MARKALPKILIGALILLLLAAVTVTLHFVGVGASRNEHAVPQPPAAPKAEKMIKYKCPMVEHPKLYDHPGTCPICGMTLIPVEIEENTQAQPGMEDHAPITLNSERRQLIGVQVGTAEKRRVTRTIRAAGRVEYDEKTLATVNLKFGGWITDLMVKSVGETVRKNSPLMAIYSPDLLEAQRNYLVARAALTALGKDAATDSRLLAEEMLRSARERLLLWDFTEEQLKAIESSGQPEHDVTIFSKVDGVVTARNVSLGGSVEPGKNLFEIADLTTVWVLADVFESEAALVKPGQQAKVVLTAVPGEPLTGTVSYIYPALDEATRTLRVRLDCPNPDGRLKPGMFAAVSIAVDLGEQLAVDDDAVLDTGVRQIVFVDKGEGRLEPREVAVGDRADGLAIIARGLEDGEKIVTSGNFLVDSESRMKAALRQVGSAAQPETKTGKTEMPGMPGM